MPSHDVVSQMDRKPIIVLDFVTAYKIDQQGEGIREQSSKEALSPNFILILVGNDNISLTDMSKNLGQNFLRFSIVTATQPVIPASRLESCVDVVGRKAPVRLVSF